MKLSSFTASWRRAGRARRLDLAGRVEQDSRARGEPPIHDVIVIVADSRETTNVAASRARDPHARWSTGSNNAARARAQI